MTYHDPCNLCRLNISFATFPLHYALQCFYNNSLEGQDGSVIGKLLYAFADKHCQNFMTCGKSGGQTSGISKVNYGIFDLLDVGSFHLLYGKCNASRATTKEITKKMYIPLIQGALQYAYEVSQEVTGEK